MYFACKYGARVHKNIKMCMFIKIKNAGGSQQMSGRNPESPEILETFLPNRLKLIQYY